jgi:hypothetical protein
MNLLKKASMKNPLHVIMNGKSVKMSYEEILTQSAILKSNV